MDADLLEASCIKGLLLAQVENMGPSVATAKAPSRLRAIAKISFSRNLAELRQAGAATWLSCDFDYESVKLVQFHILLQSNKIRFKFFLDVQTKVSSRLWQWHQVLSSHVAV